MSQTHAFLAGVLRLTEEPPPLPSAMPLNRLTMRERAVLVLVVEGLTDREIAARLHVSVKTVEAHLRHMRIKFGLLRGERVRSWLLVNLAKRDNEFLAAIAIDGGATAAYRDAPKTWTPPYQRPPQPEVSDVVACPQCGGAIITTLGPGAGHQCLPGYY